MAQTNPFRCNELARAYGPDGQLSWAWLPRRTIANGWRVKCSLPPAKHFDTIRPMTEPAIRVDQLSDVSRTPPDLCRRWFF
jgi:hypothetical protein